MFIRNNIIYIYMYTYKQQRNASFIQIMFENSKDINDFNIIKVIFTLQIAFQV